VAKTEKTRLATLAKFASELEMVDGNPTSVGSASDDEDYVEESEEEDEEETCSGVPTYFKTGQSFTYMNGDSYKGGWMYGYVASDGDPEQDGEAHGEGTLVFAGGNLYTGHWDHGWIDGWGEMTYSGIGHHYIGEWKKSLKSGMGTATYTSMTASEGCGVYTGSWLDGKREELASTSGLMAMSTRVIGLREFALGMVLSLLPMGTSMRVIGSITNVMELEQ